MCTMLYYTARDPTAMLSLNQTNTKPHVVWVCVAYGRTTRRPSFDGAAARLNDCNRLSVHYNELLWRTAKKGRKGPTLSHSSQARPAPNPRPTNAGHARRLKSRTEKTTPNETPRPERMSMDERQRSHCHDLLARAYMR